MKSILLVLLGAVLLAGATLASRTLVGSTVWGEHRVSRDCGATVDGPDVCVERWARDELLVSPGMREVRVYLMDAGAVAGGRYLVTDDPFAEREPSSMSVSWPDEGGVLLTDGVASLGFAADAVSSLGQ